MRGIFLVKVEIFLEAELIQFIAVNLTTVLIVFFFLHSVHIDQACLHLKHLCLMYYIGGKNDFLFCSALADV